MTPTQRQIRRARKARRNGGHSLATAFSISGSTVVTAVVLAFVVLVGGAMGVYAFVAKDLTPPDNLATREIARSAKIYDRHGEQLYEVFDPQFGRRTTVPLKEVSPYLVQATIATEDATFYENQGINIRGITRAAWNAMTTKEITQGGSSITQQLVKNVLIPEEERTQLSVVRKLKEAILALELTRRHSKGEILEFYLNEINYGNLSYGIEAAAGSYFGKSARELDLAESAMLAGIPQAPGRFSPLTNPDDARRRQHQVLDLMVRQEFITEAEAEQAREKELEFKAANFAIRAPHFVMYVRELISEKYGKALYSGGLKITTSLDMNLQVLGEDVVREQVAITSRSLNGRNGSLVAIDPRTGEILAMVGSVDYFDASIDGQVNVANSERQPGSAFKPFTYLTAFMKGWSPATMVVDEPVTLNDVGNRTYVVQNVDKTYKGPVAVRDALANSMNVPAIKAIQFAGVNETINTAHQMGITGLNLEGWYGPALTLGGGEVKPLDMAYAYGVFANNGVMAGEPVPSERRQPGHRTLDPVAILKVEDANGKVLEEFEAPAKKQVIPADYAYLITNILSDNSARAPLFGNRLQIGRPAAVKTGTTENQKDFWTVGYTPELSVAVWIGNTRGQELSSGLSSSTTGPIWEKYMSRALVHTPASSFQRPAGVVTATVCLPSGKLAGDICPRRTTELFAGGKAPTERDDSYVAVRIDSRTGLPALPGTPQEFIEDKTFLRGEEPPPLSPTPAAAIGSPTPVRTVVPSGPTSTPGAGPTRTPTPGSVVPPTATPTLRPPAPPPPLPPAAPPATHTPTVPGPAIRISG